MEYRNFLRLGRSFLGFRQYFFLDTEEYLADRLFIKHKVRVWFQREYGKNGSCFRMILCKVRKKDEEQFLLALEELKDKMLLMGYVKYPDFCKETMDKLGEAIESEGTKHQKSN